LLLALMRMLMWTFLQHFRLWHDTDCCFAIFIKLSIAEAYSGGLGFKPLPLHTGVFFENPILIHYLKNLSQKNPAIWGSFINDVQFLEVEGDKVWHFHIKEKKIMKILWHMGGGIKVSHVNFATKISNVSQLLILS